MKKYLSILSFMALSTSAFAIYNANFDPVELNSIASFETYYKIDGKLLGKESLNILKQAYTDKEYLIYDSKSNGLVNKDKLNSESVGYYIENNNKITIDSYHSTTKKNGEAFLASNINFDWEKMTANLSWYQSDKEKIIKKSVPLTYDTILVQDLKLFAQNMITSQLQNKTVRVLIPNGDIFNMLINVVPIPEEIEINGNKIKCYRVEMKPDLGLISIVIPNVNYWFGVEPPHKFYQYIGLLDKPGSPDVIQQRIK